MIPVEKTLNTALDTASQLHRSAFGLSRALITGEAKRMGMSKLSVMGYLYRKGKATPTELAAFMRIQPQSLTRLIADLERQKWITRRPNDADRRQSLLEITETGTKVLVKDVLAQRTVLAQAIVKALTPAEQEMLRLAAGLMDRLAEAAEKGTTRPPEAAEEEKGPVLKKQRGPQAAVVQKKKHSARSDYKRSLINSG
jgi:DNA-binding MarR family transcriptional regulator